MEKKRSHRGLAWEHTHQTKPKDSIGREQGGTGVREREGWLLFYQSVSEPDNAF